MYREPECDVEVDTVIYYCVWTSCACPPPCPACRSPSHVDIVSMSVVCTFVRLFLLHGCGGRRYGDEVIFVPSGRRRLRMSNLTRLLRLDCRVPFILSGDLKAPRSCCSPHVLAVVSNVIWVMMGKRMQKTGKMMPSGPVGALALGMAFFYVYQVSKGPVKPSVSGDSSDKKSS